MHFICSIPVFCLFYTDCTIMSIVNILVQITHIPVGICLKIHCLIYICKDWVRLIHRSWFLTFAFAKISSLRDDLLKSLNGDRELFGHMLTYSTLPKFWFAVYFVVLMWPACFTLPLRLHSCTPFIYPFLKNYFKVEINFYNFHDTNIQNHSK